MIHNPLAAPNLRRAAWQRDRLLAPPDLPEPTRPVAPFWTWLADEVDAGRCSI